MKFIKQDKTSVRKSLGIHLPSISSSIVLHLPHLMKKRSRTYSQEWGVLHWLINTVTYKWAKKRKRRILLLILAPHKFINKFINIVDDFDKCQVPINKSTRLICENSHQWSNCFTKDGFRCIWTQNSPLKANMTWKQTSHKTPLRGHELLVALNYLNYHPRYSEQCQNPKDDYPVNSLLDFPNPNQSSTKSWTLNSNWIHTKRQSPKGVAHSSLPTNQFTTTTSWSKLEKKRLKRIWCYRCTDCRIGEQLNLFVWVDDMFLLHINANLIQERRCNSVFTYFHLCFPILNPFMPLKPLPNLPRPQPLCLPRLYLPRRYLPWPYLAWPIPCDPTL